MKTPQESNEIKDQNETDEMKLCQMKELKRVDKLISSFYDDHDHKNIGKFLQYIINHKLENIPIEKQLGWDAIYSQCVYVEFDLEQFPFPYYYSNDDGWTDDYKRRVLFFTLQFIYQYDDRPTLDFLKGKLHSLSQVNNADTMHSHNYDVIRRIDKLLYQFEKQLNRHDTDCGSTHRRYFNDKNGNGKFLQFIIDQKLNTDKSSIAKQLGDECIAEDCLYTSIHLTPICTNYDKKEIIFGVIQYCYKYNKAPSVEDIKSIIKASCQTEISMPKLNKHECICGKTLLKVNSVKVYDTGKKIASDTMQFVHTRKLHVLCMLPLFIYGGFTLFNSELTIFFILGCWGFISIIGYFVMQKMTDFIHRIYLLSLICIIYIIAWPSIFVYRHVMDNTLFVCLIVMLAIGTAFFMVQIKNILPVVSVIYQKGTCVACDYSPHKKNNPFWYCTQTGIISMNHIPNIQTQYGICYNYFAICDKCTTKYAQAKSDCKPIDTITCKSDVSQCQYLSRLKNTIQTHEKNDNSYNPTNIQQTMDDFIHLMRYHNTDQQFQYIVNSFSECDISKCYMFKRNYRVRSQCQYEEQKEDKLYNNIDDERIAYCQILDKIHCHYVHCYDIGNRLSIGEQKQIEEIKHDGDNQMINLTATKLQNILFNKRKMYQDVYCLNQRMSKRYSALLENDSSKKYMLGVSFEYDSDDISSSENVKPKYWSLKEELIINDIHTISVAQFDNEYRKAGLHFTCYHRKKTWPDWRRKTISIKHILSLMVYCNFDALSYEFSKTYRRQYYFQHNNFYHMGKYIKECVHVFGTAIKYGDVATFYHGVSTKLAFPAYVGDKLIFKCPLSTSSCYCVAANFAKHNQGLIIEFHDLEKMTSCQYFSTSWLSDFSNESEYLFIQNSYGKLEIFNITDVSTGTEFKVISDALKIIEAITDPNSKETKDRQYHLNVSTEMKILVETIIKHQLSYKLSQFEPMKTIHEYARQMINTYCVNKGRLVITYPFNLESSWFHALFHDEQNCVQLHLIHAIFPNLNSRFDLININLSHSLLYQMLSFLREKHEYKNKGFWVSMVLNKDSEIDVNELLKYKEQFESMNFTIIQHKDEIRVTTITSRD